MARALGDGGRASAARRSSPSSTSRLDRSTYLLGGAHAPTNDLFTVTYPTDHLGFTYPPFSALLFAPFAHFPLRVCEVVFSWVNLAAASG